MYGVRITSDLDRDASWHAVSLVWLPIPQIELCSALQELSENLAVPRTRPHERCPDPSRPFPRIAHFWTQWESSRSFPGYRPSREEPSLPKFQLLTVRHYRQSAERSVHLLCRRRTRSWCS